LYDVLHDDTKSGLARDCLFGHVAYMSTYAIKTLAVGVVTDSQANIYAPTGVNAIVKTMRFVNAHTAAVTINVYQRQGQGTARRILPKDLLLPAGALAVEDSEITLANGDAVQAVASVASVVEFAFSGIEES
jgi:hypothetical protein